MNKFHAVPRTEAIDSFVTNYHDAPSEWTDSTWIVGTGLPPNINEPLLKNFFSFSRIGQHSNRQPVKPGRKPFIQSLKSRLIATSNLLDQLGIKLAFGVPHSHLSYYVVFSFGSPIWGTVRHPSAPAVKLERCICSV